MIKIIVSSQKQKKETIFSSVVNPKRKENPPLPEKSKSIPSNRRISSHHKSRRKKTLKSPNGFLRRQTPLEDRKLPIHAVR